MLTKLTIPALALGLALSACSAKVTSPLGGGFTPPKADAFSHKVTGPVLDGRWLSGCEVYSFGKGFVVYSMTIKGQSVNRITSEYVDQNCLYPAKEMQNKQVRDKVTVENGVFRYNVKYDAQNYEVEYRMNMEHGTYDFPENIRFDGTTLSITDHVSGQGVRPHIVLKAAN